jgi:hypothetical protein
METYGLRCASARKDQGRRTMRVQARPGRVPGPSVVPSSFDRLFLLDMRMPGKRSGCNVQGVKSIIERCSPFVENRLMLAINQRCVAKLIGRARPQPLGDFPPRTGALSSWHHAAQALHWSSCPALLAGVARFNADDTVCVAKLRC